MENESDKLLDIAMHIILESGNARNECEEAVRLARSGEFLAADEKLNMAKHKLLNAHRAQTDVIQNSAEGEAPKLTLIFIHALDTLMTVKSEINLRGDIVELYKSNMIGVEKND